MRVLAVGAHPDDVELGAGATLAKHAQAGDEVAILVLGTGITSRLGSHKAEMEALHVQAELAARALGASVTVLDFPDQRFDEVAMLDLVRSVEQAMAMFVPDTIYTHARGDRNLDHQLTHSAVLTACRPLPGGTVRSIYAFEVASSTEWGDWAFSPARFVDVTGAPLQAKLAALEHYASEMREAPHPRSIHGIKTLADWRGLTVGIEAAEAFEVLREIR